ncbi:MAG: hypothetical protein JWO31_1191 [Phycisphaerales bacterium]|nr:hypothetical protein [Phycisphaerales bacterium]
MTFIAGAYAFTYKAPGGGSPASIGATEQGFELRDQMHMEPIQSDDYGEGRAGGIQQGRSASVRLTGIEYGAMRAAIYSSHPLGDAKANVGRSMHDLAGEIVATPTTGTPAAALEGTYTFKYAACASDLEMIFGSKLRKVPVTFDLLPDPATGKLWVVGAGSSGGGT